MNRLKGKWVLITGATAGIGLETARLFAEMQANLILVGRRKKNLSDLKGQLMQMHSIEVETGVLDVQDTALVENFVSSLPAPVDVLVNNAGLALGTDPIFKVSPDDWNTMIDTNVKGLVAFSRYVIPLMMERNSGHVINVGSIAGHQTYPGGAIYNATKYAVRAITEATKKDVHGTNIRVSMVSPGLVETEFSKVRFRGDEEKAASVYGGLDPLTGLDIAEIIVFIANRPNHVNILDTIIYPVAQSSSTMVHRS